MITPLDIWTLGIIPAFLFINKFTSISFGVSEARNDIWEGLVKIFLSAMWPVSVPIILHAVITGKKKV